MKHICKTLLAIMGMLVITAGMVFAGDQEQVAEADSGLQDQQDYPETDVAPQDLKDYLWKVPEGADPEDMVKLVSRNNTIIEDLETFFTEESYKEYQKAFAKFKQNRNTATAEDANAVADVLVQVKPLTGNIVLIWDGQTMPVVDGETITEEGLDKGGRLYSYGYDPRLIKMLAEDPQTAKGNLIILCRNHSGDAVEGHPAAIAYQAMGYNVFMLAMRSAPYSVDDAAMDLQRAIRLVKKEAAENHYGGQDMIAVASWGGAGTAEMTVFFNMFGNLTPADGYCSSYVPDEIDAISADFDVAVMIYSAFKVLDEAPEETDGFQGYVVKKEMDNPSLPAFYICTGDLDNTGRYEDSLALYNLIKDQTDCKLTVMTGAGHGFGIGQESAAHITEECKNLLPESDEFMQSHLGYSVTEDTDAGMEEVVVEDTETVESGIEAIYFPDAPEEFVKAKAFYGYYILMDTDVIFALNEDETRFAVQFYGMGGKMPTFIMGNVYSDGTVEADSNFIGLYGEDLQTMYEDALEEEADWAPITR
ncbi:MAG: hypothetical protein IKG67_11070 [Parasporobacterium sp.]|nr:hypothetical protein [Parasporobacterium sp.]